MTKQERQERAWPKWFSIDGPYIWLAYLPFFFIPWFFSTPTTPQIVGGLVGLTVFLGLYFAAVPTAGARLIGYAAAILVLSFALAFTHGNWTVIAIYAAALIAQLRPMRRASILLGAFAITTLAAGLALQQSPFYWAFGVFFMVMVGAANISRAALEDKNRALANAQEEVKQMAATAERERIGRDLHDLLGRTLTLIAIKADLAVKLSPRDPARAETEMREVAAAARDALAEVRAAVAGMTGATL
ncbi:MAG: two-component sensor histidine kinase, partial [Phycisphaerales bacterium]|nr:two-component sensor histidine kinase [Hyphomonadaceae bacterium]